MEQIVDITTDGRQLSANRGFLIVSEDRHEVGRIPLDDITAVIVHAHDITWSTNLIVALVERGPDAAVRVQSCAGGGLFAA